MIDATDIVKIRIAIDVYEVRDLTTGLLVADIKCRMESTERIR